MSPAHRSSTIFQAIRGVLNYHNARIGQGGAAASRPTAGYSTSPERQGAASFGTIATHPRFCS